MNLFILIVASVFTIGAAVFATLTHRSANKAVKYALDNVKMVYVKLQQSAPDFCPHCAGLVATALKEAEIENAAVDGGCHIDPMTTRDAAPIKFQTSPHERMRITAANHVWLFCEHDWNYCVTCSGWPCGGAEKVIPYCAACTSEKG